MSADTPSDPDQLLLRDLLDRQPLLVAINVLVALLAVPVFANAASFPIVAIWLGAMALIQAGRTAVWRVARGWEIEPARGRLGFCLTATSTAAGLGWGAAGALFGSGASQAAGIFVPFVLSGMSAGAVTSLPGYPPAFFAFVWAALLPYAGRLAAAPDLSSRVMAGLTLFYAVGVSAVGYQVHRNLRRAAELHFQNAGLVRRLDEARQGLEATVAHRTLELRTAVDSLSREVGERRRSEERVRHLLAHDPLTGLPNRLLLLDRLAQGLARSRRFGTRTAVMAVDIDRFKDVNDAFGHPAGDRLLRELAQRVRGAIRATDTAARLGGDEFALVAPDLADARQALTLAERLLGACRAPFEVGDCRLQVAVSVGVALFPEHGEDSDTLLRAADAALYDAKAGGRDRIRLYSQAMHASLQERRRLELELRQAPARRQLRLAYQPRFAITDRRLMGVEALRLCRTFGDGGWPPALVWRREPTPCASFGPHRSSHRALSWSMPNATARRCG